MVIYQDTRDQVVIHHQGVNIVISQLTEGTESGNVVIYAERDGQALELVDGLTLTEVTIKKEKFI